jgi:hypothetical protein
MSADIVPAHLAVQAMRDNGYKNAAYAIAELMDNSIQAKASVVELLCAERVELVDQRRRSRIHQVAVLDNGCGMDADVLKIALQFGNGTNLAPEKQIDMGKFGMGLPNASISQCMRVEVWSWQHGLDSALYTYLDVDEVRHRRQTTIPEPVSRAIPALWRQVGTAFGQSGTLVVWSKLDRIMWRTAASIIDNSEFLVGRMYRRFLHSGNVSIRMVAFDVDNPVLTATVKEALPNDPGYLMARTSCAEPFNKAPMFEPWPSDEYNEVKHTVRFRGEEHIVTTRFSIAKKEARQGNNPGSLPHGKHAEKNTGISIMRAGRELDLDQSWVIKYDPVERWWGVEIEFPPALDELFGVTNNKQAARNFAELSKLDLDTLLKDRTETQAMDQLIEEDDPRAPLLEIAHRIRVNLPKMREWLKKQTEGSRTKTKRYDPNSPEVIATAATRARQQEGHQGASDKGEELPPEQRQAEIERTLVDEGVPEETAKELAATTVSDGLKYVFAEADLETYAFFTVKQRGGAMVITLNTNHPAYHHLVEVLQRDETTSDTGKLQNRLGRAADGLKLLLSAWARYEDEQTDSRRRQQVQDARSDWGRMARRFLERED